ncbi:sensor histidine kinase [Carnobacterium maltaromaticum]|uniref:sensor histidine kinase n=1 Tax=Carnobacterium maltaromaticum TaxID=2751 RepID=UPI00054E6BAD|nr:HAMP domain-containing sensor histidine kinase [Carnobacterium maltaromaticum]
MKRTIKWQLIVSFLLLSSLIIGSLSFITISLMNNHFEKYVKERQEETLTQYVESIELLFNYSEQNWQTQGIGDIGKKALENNIIIEVYDRNNKILWAPSKTEKSKATKKMNIYAKYLKNKLDITNTNVVKIEKNLTYKESTIGKVLFRHVGPLSYTKHDVVFISDMKKNLMIVSFAALFISFIFATWVSRKMSIPLTHVNDFTKKVANGDYSQQIPQETSILEINELISSVNELTRQLEQQQELRKRLSTDIAHEIRTPLTTLKGNIEGMLDGIWDVSTERLQSCYDEVTRLTRLIGNIEKLTKLEKNYEKLIKSNFNLNSLIFQVVTNFDSSIKQKEIQFNLYGEEISVFADKDKFSQVMTNLLANAIKFTQKYGEISISLNKVGNNVEIKVKDNGIGINEEEVEHIFDRFYMADPARSSSQGGQGIGLAIVKSIVEAHSGSIRVESNLGTGSCFFIKLPIKNRL